MHSLIGEYDSRWCFSYLPKRAPRPKDLLTVLPKPISLPKPITLNPLCIFVTTSLLKTGISLWWMLNKTTLLSHILLTFNKLLCKFAPKINVMGPLSRGATAGVGRGWSVCRLAVLVYPCSQAVTSIWTHTIYQILFLPVRTAILLFFTLVLALQLENGADRLVN